MLGVVASRSRETLRHRELLQCQHCPLPRVWLRMIQLGYQHRYNGGIAQLPQQLGELAASVPVGRTVQLSNEPGYNFRPGWTLTPVGILERRRVSVPNPRDPQIEFQESPLRCCRTPSSPARGGRGTYGPPEP